MQGRKTTRTAARLRAKDRSIHYVVIDSSGLFENARFIHTRCFTRDITKQRMAENALRQSEQQLRVITEATPVMIWLSGTDRLCYYFNKTWLDFVGRDLQQEIGNGWTENVHPDDFDRCLQIYMTSFDARKPFEMEYRLRHRSGEYRWILDHGVPRTTRDGAFEGYVGGCLNSRSEGSGTEGPRRRRHSSSKQGTPRRSVGGFRYRNFQMGPANGSGQMDASLQGLLGLELQRVNHGGLCSPSASRRCGAIDLRS